MTQDPDARPAPDLPHVEEVERALELDPADRGDLPGLHRLNVVRVPLVRALGFALALLAVPVHEVLVRGRLDVAGYLALTGAVAAYCAGSWLALRTLFVRLRPFHLGTFFVWADLVPMTGIVAFTGGPASLLWPIYLVRVADQMWIGRGRALALGLGGMVCYGALAAAAAATGAPVAWGAEAVKLVVLGGMAVVLAAVAGQPLDVQGKAIAARDLILRLERQSEELDAERRRAEDASRAKSEFLARMSHELRTPLNSVVGFANVLQRRRSAMEPRDAEYLERIRQNGMHLLALVNDILDLARIEEGRMDVQPTDVDVRALVRETVAQLEPRAAGAGDVTLVARAPSGLAPVRADEARLRQVLINLVGNALKFTERGSVSVEVEARDGRPARIRVRDTGIGIPADRLESIFDPFEQADGSSTRRHGGTGLGLAISRSLCRLMGFDLTVTSRPGVGSVFTVDLQPRGDAATSASGSAGSGTGNRAGGSGGPG